jgi:CRISPR/Cas system-associated exonuclease Cas4 (RecB family)
LKSAGLLPVRPANLERALEILEEAGAEVAKEYEDRLAPAIPRVWQDALAGIRADLREWLRRQAGDTEGWVPHRFELSFGIVDRDRAHEDPGSVRDPVTLDVGLKLRGSVDLVERQPHGVLRVTDYKTGKVRSKPGVVVGGGEVLQPVLYALAVERLLGEPVEAGRLYYCTADGGYTERVVPLDAASRAAAAEVTAIVGGALEAGFLPAAPREQACRWCDYRPVCGPWEEQRTRGKPADRIRDLLRLRELP